VRAWRLVTGDLNLDLDLDAAAAPATHQLAGGKLLSQLGI
jgi:hypothetical protein